MKTKKSFGNEDTFPAVAFIDARYTESMSYETTVDTALDAFTHALEDIWEEGAHRSVIFGC